jgi:methyl-accepting chemotaxis protein
MNFFRDVSLQKKLIFIITPLSVIIFSLLVNIFADQISDINSAGKLKDASRLAAEVSSVVHVLQEEREMSAAFVASRGKDFSDELPKQFEKVDNAIVRLTKVLNEVDISSNEFEFSETRKKVKNEVKKVSGFRDDVKSFKINSDETIKKYTKLNSSLLDNLEKFSHASNESEFTERYNALVSFLRAKDISGIERAVLSKVYGRQQFIDDEYEQFIALTSKQEVYVNFFYKLASHKAKEFFKKKSETKAFSDVGKMRENAFNYNFDLSAEESYAVSTEKIVLLKQIDNMLIKGISHFAEELSSSAVWAMIFTLIWVVALATISVVLIKRITFIVLNTLQEMKKATLNIIMGDFEKRIEVENQDEFGELAELFNDMVTSIKSAADTQLEEAERMMKDNSRLLAAIENVSTNVTIADNDRKIIYANKSVLKMFKSRESTIQKQIPEFQSDKILNSTMDNYHKDPEHQAKLLSEFNETYQTEMNLAGLTFALIANPIFSKKGKRLGSVVEWADRTEEVKAQKDVQTVIQAAKAGELNERIALENKFGFWKQISEDINEMLNAITIPIGRSLEILEKISQGVIDQKITEDYEGDHAKMKNAVNRVSDVINRLGEEMIRLSNAAGRGDMSVRGNDNEFEGGYREIVRGVNNMLTEIVEPINESVNVMQKMSENDLSYKVNGEYSGDHAFIKDALNKSLDSLNELMNQVSLNVRQVSAGSNQLATTSNELSKGAQQQASAIEEISSTLTELTSQTKQNTDNAFQANQLSQKVGNDADVGNSKMRLMLGAMKEINSASEDISKIIKVIDEIAFQTNLLALNAAVEAARAGQHGKGFAVVAEEVRNLAQRSANAARETTDLIETTMKRVEYGSSIANETDEALSEILQGVGKVSDIVGEIAAASQEQSRGIEQVNKAITEIDKVTQSNSAGAEETAAASEELAAQSTEVQNLISRFKLDESSQSNTIKPVMMSERHEKFRAEKKEVKETKHTNPEDIISLDDVDFGDF